ncbi:hypothetical protein PR048_022453 [Dryococelus australis]|uniref:Rap-GAP domain-containing protein n=1 Tax=Dryococelus australis TaxID=614101 RepID=A0ABQ9H145_9NEOP|nr:hypothetical protein PR048_022453 [Dryococelus australis]
MYKITFDPWTTLNVTHQAFPKAELERLRSQLAGRTLPELVAAHRTPFFERVNISRLSPACGVNHYQHLSNSYDRTPKRTSWWDQAISWCSCLFSMALVGFRKPTARVMANRGIQKYDSTEVFCACLSIELSQAQQLHKIFKSVYRKSVSGERRKLYSTHNGCNPFCGQNGSPEFDRFVHLLGDKIRLKGWDKYRGGLDVKGDMTGKYSIYTIYEGHEIMFHVSTLLPYSKDNRQQLKVPPELWEKLIRRSLRACAELVSSSHSSRQLDHQTRDGRYLTEDGCERSPEVKRLLFSAQGGEINGRVRVSRDLHDRAVRVLNLSNFLPGSREFAIKKKSPAVIFPRSSLLRWKSFSLLRTRECRITTEGCAEVIGRRECRITTEGCAEVIGRRECRITTEGCAEVIGRPECRITTEGCAEVIGRPRGVASQLKDAPRLLVDASVASQLKDAPRLLVDASVASQLKDAPRLLVDAGVSHHLTVEAGRGVQQHTSWDFACRQRSRFDMVALDQANYPVPLSNRARDDNTSSLSHAHRPTPELAGKRLTTHKGAQLPTLYRTPSVCEHKPKYRAIAKEPSSHEFQNMAPGWTLVVHGENCFDQLYVRWVNKTWGHAQVKEMGSTTPVVCVCAMLQVERKRHIGNDIVNIVYLDGGTQQMNHFNPSFIKSQFTREQRSTNLLYHATLRVTLMSKLLLGVCPWDDLVSSAADSPSTDVFALVTHMGDDNGGYRLALYSEESVPLFGPSLPCPPVFRNAEEFREFLLVKREHTVRERAELSNAKVAHGVHVQRHGNGHGCIRRSSSVHAACTQRTKKCISVGIANFENTCYHVSTICMLMLYADAVCLINGEKAAFNTPTFSQKRERTLDMLIKDLYSEHMNEGRGVSLLPLLYKSTYLGEKWDDSVPRADLQRNKHRVQVWGNIGYSLGATANEHTAEARVYTVVWRIANGSLNSRNTMLNRRAFSDVLPDAPRGSRRKEEARQVEFVRIGQALKLDTIVKGDAPTSLATTGLFKRAPWEPHCFYPDFAHEVVCGDSWGDSRLIVATESGIFLVEGEASDVEWRYRLNMSIESR